MIEVMISTMLVAIIAVGTLSGFDSAGRASADERSHAQATTLAQQDEERLRGLTATELGQLGTSKRTVVEGGNTFTITSSARYVTAEKESFTCETNEGTADYLQTTSSVTWPALGTRQPVSQSSIVSAPASAAVLVKVINQANEPVEGATVGVTGAPSQTTSASGCVIIGGLATGTVTVSAEKGAYVDPQGKTPTPTKSVNVSTTTLATATFQLAPPGSIVASFESNKLPVSGDTFFAADTGIATPSNFVGGTASKYAPTVTLAGLFPFASPSPPYTVFAGDCEKNNPEVVTAKAVKDPTAQVNPLLPTAVTVEAPAVNFTVYEGTSAAKGNPVAVSTSGKIINVECAATASQNFASVPYEHEVHLEAGGHVAQRYQPYAKKLEFCIVALISGNYYKYKTPVAFANTSKTGTGEMFVYLKEVTSGYTKSASKIEC
jgi:hypothetical protein